MLDSLGFSFTGAILADLLFMQADAGKSSQNERILAGVTTGVKERANRQAFCTQVDASGMS
jgi:hypothetical protein